MPKEVRFRIIHELRQRHRLCWLIRIAGVSRQGYYKWLKRQVQPSARQRKNQEIKNHIVAIHKIRPYYGYPRMVIALGNKGYPVNHKRVYRLMKELGIQAVIRKKRRKWGKKESSVQPNRLARNFKAALPHQKLVTDITYIPFQGQNFYLSAVQDVFDNVIVAYQTSSRNDLKIVLDTIEQVHKKINVQGAIIHSDQGFQYTSTVYNQRLEALGMVGSHSRKGNCLDNACIESFFSHFKTEMLYINKFTTVEELFQAIDEYIHFYNNERFQKRLGYLAPIQYRQKMVI